MKALENISKSFGRKLVLNNFSLDLADSGVTCLLGRSGSGKSTALKIAAGLLKPDSGKVGIPAGSSGVVFQDARLLPWLTVEENLALALPPEKREKQELERALFSVSLNPEETLKLFPRELSGGMAQRASIARAMLRGSSYLLLDEPFASLDAITRADHQRMIMELARTRKTPALFVTHDIDEALKIGERILITANGKITAAFEKQPDGCWPDLEKTRMLALASL